MTEKQQQLLFDKGITNVPSDALCSDNALSESVGMVYDNGEHRVVQKPVGVPGLEARYDMLFVHTFNGEKRYVYKLGSGVYWRKASDSKDHLLLTDSSNPQVTAIGKTLVVADNNGMHYFLRKESDYTNIGKLPEVEFDCRLQSYRPQMLGETTREWDMVVNDLKHELWNVDQKIKDQETYNNTVAGLYAKNKKAVAQKRGFCEPFFVRTAIKMYDGSYTHISQPILMLPSVYGNSVSIMYSNALRIYTMYARMILTQKTDFSPWSDIVKDIVIFISDGIDPYDTSVDQPFNNGNVNVTVDGVYYTPALSINYRQNTYPVGTNAWGGNCLKKKEPKQIDSDIKATSIFYEICSIGIKPIAGKDIADYINVHDLENLTSKPQLEHDDYYSRSPIYPKTLFAYNSRLNLANMERGMFEGYHNFMPLDGDSERTYKFYVSIKLDNGSVVTVCHEAKTIQRQGGYFFYPDSRAIHVTIIRGGGASSGSVCDEELTEHPFLNGAYFFRGFDKMISGSTMTPEAPKPVVVPQYDNNYRELLPNQIITSEVNNPFVFNADGYNVVGIGKIIGMSSTTQALSEGQFGAYPLLVFATDGIWAMSVNNTGLYQTIRPMSREVALEDNPCLTQTDGAVFFISKKGLMVVSGGQVRCVSPQLSGKNIPSAFQTADLGDAMSFFYNCMIAYDYRDSLLWIMNSAYNKCYIYSIGSGVFGKYDFGNYNNTSPIVPMCVVNDYPDYLICTTTSVLSLLNRPTINSDVNSYSGTMISRPMKLENAFALKSLMHINHIHTLSEGASLEFGIYGSNDLRNWVGLTSLRGTPWLYYRFRYDFSKMKAVDRFAGTLAVTQERRTDKPRTYVGLSADLYNYSIKSLYLPVWPDIEIPIGEETATVLLVYEFYRQKGSAAEEAAECYWSLWEVKKDGSYIKLYNGRDTEASKSVTVTEQTSSVLICTNADEEPDPRNPLSMQAFLPISVRKESEESQYTYSVSVNTNQIVIPQGENSVEAYVSAYAMRSANGTTEAFDCYIKAWKVIDGVYTVIAENSQMGGGLAFVDVFSRNSPNVTAYVIFAISNEPMSDEWTGDYLATSQNIVIDSSSSVTPEPGPTPTPTPTSDFDGLLGEFNNVLNACGLNSVTEEDTPNLYSYLQTAYDMAVDEWEDPDSELFDEDTYPELYTGTDYRGTNTDYNETARESLLSWLMAMLLEEIVPSSAAQGEVTNTQTEFFKLAYNRVDPNGDGKNIPLYGGFEIHSDPMIARLAAGGVYAKVRSSKTFAEIEEMRKEFYGDSNDHWIPASDWSGLGYTHTEVKNGNDERIGYNMDSLGYLVNTSLFLPSSPGPRVAGCFVDNEPLPSTQGQNPSLFISDDNYDVDDKINDFMVDNYRMMAQTPLSVWNGYSAEIKKRLVQVMATARCTYMFMFGSPIDVSLVLDDGELPVVDGYNRYVFEESAIETGLRIDGPFSDLAGIYRYNIPNENKTLQELFLETVAEIADDGRYPTFDPNFGRRRPGCGDTISGTEANPIHGSAENELYNISISCMVADNASQKTSWAAEDGFAADRPNSYPSGHTAQVWTHAMMLGQMDPSRLTVWMRRAYEFSVNRSIGRAHWNSDLMYGRLFATMVVPLINAMNGVQAGYNAVKETVLGGGGVTNPVISINIAIVNNSGSAVTLDGDLKFTLGNPDHNGNYLGWNGPYNGTPHLRFSPDVVTLEAGETRTFYGITWRDEDTGCGFGEKSPANAEQLAASERPRNVLFYVGGNSEVVMANNMDPAIIFEDGQTYTVTLG